MLLQMGKIIRLVQDGLLVFLKAFLILKKMDLLENHETNPFKNQLIVMYSQPQSIPDCFVRELMKEFDRRGWERVHYAEGS